MNTSTPLTNTLAPAHHVAKLIRHGLAMGGGYLATQGFSGDVNRPSDLMLALLLFVCATVWSWISQHAVARRLADSLTPDQRREYTGRGRLILEAIAGQLVAAVAGSLQANGDSTEAMAIAGLNYVLSSINRPGISKEVGKEPVMLMKVMATLLLPVLLVGCVTAKGNDKTGDWAIAAAGVDAEKLAATSKGFIADKVNMSTAFKATLKTVEKLWQDYLTLQGFQFIGGKYYDHLGKELDATTSVKLTELKNAQDLAMAQQKLKELETVHALGEASGN